MKVLVFSHHLEVGGSQTNAIDLATYCRDTYGIESVFFAAPGPMATVLEQRGLRLIEAPASYGRPSPAVMRCLARALRSEKPDLMHVWDWWQYADALLPAHRVSRTPLIVTDTLSEYMRRPLPRRRLVTLGTPDLAERARALGHRFAVSLVPPVDIAFNSPGVVDDTEFRSKHGLTTETTSLVTVSRLVETLKGESLRRSIDAVGMIGSDFPVRFLIAGDGEARSALEKQGTDVNRRIGYEAITFLGEVSDPRPIYSAADIVLGMGGSALRGMAFGKPVIVLGANGFSSTLTAQTSTSFLFRGMYGIGDGDAGNAQLIEQIRAIAQDATYARSLGEFSAQFVSNNFSLEHISQRLAAYYEVAAAWPSRGRDVLRELASLAVFLQPHKLASRKLVRLVSSPRSER